MVVDVVGNCGWLWVAAGGVELLWVIVGCCGWLWVVLYFSITHSVNHRKFA